DDELDAAALDDDVERRDELGVERAALIAELKRATGLGGRPRRSRAPAGKARLHAAPAIPPPLPPPSPNGPAPASPPHGFILTGVACCYEPRANIVWTT